MNRSYSELRTLDNFEDRFEYLRLAGLVGRSTFGFDRYLNQRFYTSNTWRRIRDSVIIRDKGCDLGVEGHEIFDRVIVHHMNPISVEELTHGSEKILNPNFLICVSRLTHQAIHFGDAGLLPKPIVKRRPGDTRLW